MIYSTRKLPIGVHTIRLLPILSNIKTTIKGSMTMMTHLQTSSTSWHFFWSWLLTLEEYCVTECFSIQKLSGLHNPDFLLICLFAKCVCTETLFWEENCKLVNQTLQYRNKFNQQFHRLPSLKPMDSFGTWRKLKIYRPIYFFMQNFIELYELLMPC